MTASIRPTIDVCICTFRRKFLLETLKSVAVLDADGIDVSVIVSDNDTEPSARGAIEALQPTFPFPLLYLHSPARNVSIARNACLAAADADYVAFIDDDETAAPQWLQQLLRTAEASDLDAVLGPVKAQYEGGVPDWVSAGDFHSAAPVFVGGEIRTGYTCNALIRLKPRAAGLRFDLALGQSGGEDTDFFYRLHALGGKIGYAPDALVLEPVPTHRARLAWLMARRFRAGQTHAFCLRRAGEPSSPAATAGLAFAKVVHCLVMMSLTAFSPVRWRRNLLRATLHVGVLGGLFGVRQPVQYGHARYR